MIPIGSKFAASSRTSAVVSLDLGLLAAHDPGERDRALGVGDHEVGGLELPVDAVEGAERLARSRAPDDDPCPRASVAKSNACSGLPEREHHVVRHVDDVRDRPHAGRGQPRLQPHRRRANHSVRMQLTNG